MSVEGVVKNLSGSREAGRGDYNGHGVYCAKSTVNLLINYADKKPSQISYTLVA
jgi:hypothetical protein